MHLNSKIAVASLGCAKNLVDTENMLGLLVEAGYTLVDDAAEADVIVINTCAFIGDAKQESIETILDLAQYKENGSCKALIVTGCLAERYHSEIQKELPEVDAIVGTGDFYRICEVVEDTLARRPMPVLCGHMNAPVPEGLARITTTPPYTAYLKIAEGCDNRCTYCVIPSLRGRYRSRRMEDIYDEAVSLVNAGVRELILIAQDTSRYGTDLYGVGSLDRLLRKLCEIDALRWIRIHYLYPEAISDSLLQVMAEEKKICRYFDIPIQHVNNEVLRRMGRHTSQQQLVELVSRIRSRMPDAVLRTSVIVGFPGETNEQFAELLEVLGQLRFDRLGVFAYSREENTPAARLKMQVPEKVKQQRRDTLLRMAQDISKENNENKVGSVIEVLCEGFDEENCLYYGRSRADSIDIDGKVYFGAHKELCAGEFVAVKILCGEEYDLTGEMIL